MAAIVSVLCLYSSCVGTWRDPNPPVTFNVKSNSTNPVKVGDVVEFNCTAYNLTRPESTIMWKQMRGSVEHRMKAGHSSLIWRKTISASDHDTAVFCAASFLTGESGSYQMYYAMSTKIPIEVEGGHTQVVKQVNKKPQKITLSVRPQASSYKVGDFVQYTCTTENMPFPVIDIRQRKGLIEREIYTGFQAGGYRWLGHNLTENDNDSTVYCQVWLLDDSWNSYAVNSEPFALRVQ